MSSKATRSYLMQRVTGAIMIPISVWILFFLLPKIGIIIFRHEKDRYEALYYIFSGIDNITYMLIFAICGLYHGILGMQSVINDYIHCHIMKKFAIIAIYGFAIFSAIFLTVFSFNMHVKIPQYNQINHKIIYG